MPSPTSMLRVSGFATPRCLPYKRLGSQVEICSPDLNRCETYTNEQITSTRNLGRRIRLPTRDEWMDNSPLSTPVWVYNQCHNKHP